MSFVNALASARTANQASGHPTLVGLFKHLMSQSPGMGAQTDQEMQRMAQATPPMGAAGVRPNTVVDQMWGRLSQPRTDARQFSGAMENMRSQNQMPIGMGQMTDREMQMMPVGQNGNGQMPIGALAEILKHLFGGGQ